MEWWAALAIAAAVVGAAAIVGALARRGQGRVRTTADGEVFAPGDLPGVDELGTTATIVQFSTEYCTGCVPTRRLLGTIVDARDDVVRYEVDLTTRGDLAARLHILQTPTTFVLDAHGRLTARIGGLPKRESVVTAIEAIESTSERHAS